MTSFKMLFLFLKFIPSLDFCSLNYDTRQYTNFSLVLSSYFVSCDPHLSWHNTFNINRSVFCECTHLYIPTHAPKLYKITSTVCVSTYILSLTINRHTHGNVNRKKWKINTYEQHSWIRRRNTMYTYIVYVYIFNIVCVNFIY
jgi:hypothetical protein